MANSDKVPLILLPGGMMPGLLRYPPLIEALGPGVEPVIKELEVYAGPSIPEDYSVDMEVEAISRKGDEAEMARFHLYGYSGGGAFALAYVATHPDRVLSLAIDEPATDFSEEQTRRRMPRPPTWPACDRSPLTERLIAHASMRSARGRSCCRPQWTLRHVLSPMRRGGLLSP